MKEMTLFECVSLVSNWLKTIKDDYYRDSYITKDEFTAVLTIKNFTEQNL